ncbi:flagellin N-terminal helical domain-containing protein [Paenibacillus xylaniclasticus]|uniref:flagellin N-terminal helical domain-containing protein n=1 Tax=Paenibacillus xylaniclasticus TaxID=588083 RepID=UPI000FD77815|nr:MULTISPECIES: flagellin [Paenibacillus]GFN32654.1 flagellin [Paenibacillus curdlanolyticus]
MIINHNLNAMNSHRNLVFNNIQQGKSSEKLSSGYRINRAADDAAGLSISQKMRADIRAMNQGMRNTQDGISMVQAAEGAMNEISDMLTRMKELVTQASNGTLTEAEDIAAIQNEYSNLSSEINRIAENFTFNGITLLDGSGGNITIQTAGKDTDQIVLDFSGIDAKINFGTLTDQASARTENGVVDAAISQINTARSTLGAYQNRLEHTYNNVGVNAENLQAAESRIRDTDMAAEMMNYTKFNILQQASTAMLAQANQAPQGVLQLLR